MAFLSAVGWAIIILLALVWVLVILILLGRISFQLWARVAVEGTTEECPGPGSWLAALEPASQDDDTGIGLDYQLGFSMSILGGLLCADQHGVRLLGRRVSQGRRRARGMRPTRRKGMRKPSTRRPRGKLRVRLGDLPGLGRLSWKALQQSWAALRLALAMEATCGLEDPASTGMLAGCIAASVNPVVQSLDARSPGSISCRFSPVFDREIYMLECVLRGRPRPISVVWPWLRFFLHRKVRRLWWPRARRRRKKTGRE